MTHSFSQNHGSMEIARKMKGNSCWKIPTNIHWTTIVGGSVNLHISYSSTKRHHHHACTPTSTASIVPYGHVVSSSHVATNGKPNVMDLSCNRGATAGDFPWNPGCSIQLMVQKSGVHQLRLVGFPIIYKLWYIPCGAGFLPSTVAILTIVYEILPI